MQPPFRLRSTNGLLFFKTKWLNSYHTTQRKCCAPSTTIGQKKTRGGGGCGLKCKRFLTSRKGFGPGNKMRTNGIMETEKQKLQLRERSTGLIATLTDRDKAREYERALTIHKAVSDGVPISVLKQAVGGRQIAQALDIQLTRLVAALNLKWSLNDSQIKIVVEDLLDKYPNETLDDFIVVFKRARTGEYGELIRLDGPIVFSWMEAYMDEKYRIIEENLHKEKDEYYKTIIPVNSDRDWLGEWQKAMSENGVAAVPKLSPDEVEKYGQAKPYREPHPFNVSEAEIKLRETRSKIAECQARIVRERYPSMTEDEVQARVRELQAYTTDRENNPEMSAAVKKIMLSKRRKQA